MWRLRQQLAYLFWITVLIAVIGYGIFWLSKPEPTCFDGKLNGSESGIDCGGVCQRVCEEAVSPITTLWARALPQFNSKGEFLGRLVLASLNQNPNTAGVSELLWRAKIFNSNGIIIAQTEGETYANALDEFVVFKNDITSTDSKPAQVFMEFSPKQWEKVPHAAPKLSAITTNFETTNFTRLSAKLTNDSLVDLKDVVVSALLLDQDGNVFAASQTTVDILPKRSTKDIYFTWPETFASSPATTLLLPRVDVFEM